MSFCSFTKEYENKAYTDIENAFITQYLPEASEKALKIYLYGLYLCQKTDGEYSAENMSDALKISINDLTDAYKYWEEFGLISIVSLSPLTVKYLPLNSYSARAKKFKPEKYTEFNSALQSLLDRLITDNEYIAYMNAMEDFSIKPEAMILIVKYCINQKGRNIGKNYIMAVVKDFVSRGLNTVDTIEKELQYYDLKNSEIAKLLAALGKKRAPTIDDVALLDKWLKLGYDYDAIMHIASSLKKSDTDKLDEYISELYARKLFSTSEIDKYKAEKDSINKLTDKILSALGLYFPAKDTVTVNFVSPWLSMGFSEETILTIANYTFKRGKNVSLQGMNETLKKLYSGGYITASSIASYLKGNAKNEKYIKQILSICGIDRTVTDWDKQNVVTWRNWNFSDEMILYAAECAAKAKQPIPYINAVLSSWKQKDIWTVDDAKKNTTVGVSTSATDKRDKKHFENERSYSQEELDGIVSSLKDFDI